MRFHDVKKMRLEKVEKHYIMGPSRERTSLFAATGALATPGGHVMKRQRSGTKQIHQNT